MDIKSLIRELSTQYEHVGFCKHLNTITVTGKRFYKRGVDRLARITGIGSDSPKLTIYQLEMNQHCKTQLRQYCLLQRKVAK